jgi:phospholipase/lecithinase/hemolysin
MRPESLCSFVSPFAMKNYVRSPQSRTRLVLSRTLLAYALFAIFGSALALAEVKDYSTIVVFGDSLSDTGNVTHLTYTQYGYAIPGPVVNYTLGQFTDGYDTVPAAQKYFGNWIEQFAASLPSHPEVKDSLDGGTNYAYGFATTGGGTSPLSFGPSHLFPVQVKNIGQQITDYLSTHPKIDRHTLFILWGGSIDLLGATSQKDVVTAALQQVLNIQRLIDAGATQFLVANVPPLGLTPRLNGSPVASATATAGSALFNSYLKTGISVLKDFYWFRHPKVYQLDTFRLLSQIVAAPSAYSLTNVTTPAQGQFSVNPDTYLFWDDLHPTSRGNNLLAHTAVGLLTH